MQIIFFDVVGVLLSTGKFKTKNGLVEYMDTIVKELTKNHILVIVSSLSKSTIEEQINLWKLNTVFTHVIGGEPNKNKTDQMLDVCYEYNVAPKTCLMVTDTARDVHLAKEANISTLAVSWGLGNIEMLKKSNATLVQNPQELLIIIKEKIKTLV